MRITVLTDTFPEVSETFIVAELEALRTAGWEARVEASRRALRQDLTAVRRHRASYAEDDAPAAKLAALLWLVLRHPVGCARDLLARRRWRRQEHVPPLYAIAPAAWRIARRRERHLHAHFAAGAALTAMRIAAITGRPYSVTAHAYDIFQHPRNLREKLERSLFATSGCRYNLEHLRRVAPGANLHLVVMGVDPAHFRRTQPAPAGRRLIAVGRLVEKKGFGDLLDAVATLERSDHPAETLQIIGDGPLRDSLHAQARRLGLQARVQFSGTLAHEAVRHAIERADALVMPSVIAADGDRDSMPVVVKEAMALEVPVIATATAGLPELVDDAVGRLVPPADPAALAAALAGLLSLPQAERVRIGRAGRARVLECCTAERQAAALLTLIRTGGRHAAPR